MSKGLVSLIVPVYNEAENIETSLKLMTDRLGELGVRFEIVVVESGSTDDSRQIIEKFSKANKRVRLFHQEKREGMGSAIALGFAESRGDYLFWIDSDTPYDLLYLKKGIALLSDADVVAGYRLTRDESFKRKLYSAVFNFMMNTFYSLKIRDINFAFKLFRKDVFSEIEISSKSSFFAAEILIKCRRKNLRVKQLGVEYTPREVGRSKLGNVKTILFILKEMIRFVFFG